VSGRWSSAGSLSAARVGFVLVALRDGGAIAAGGVGEPGASGDEHVDGHHPDA
jgi:hypothetical protein